MTKLLEALELDLYETLVLEQYSRLSQSAEIKNLQKMIAGDVAEWTKKQAPKPKPIKPKSPLEILRSKFGFKK